MTNEITKYDDLIDLRDVIARVEELREDRDADEYEKWQESEASQELALLTVLLSECKGNGGDEQWEGDWYPATLVRDSYFETYAQELADDIGAINSYATWPNSCIDWERAARELQQDYTLVDFDDVDYWTR